MCRPIKISIQWILNLMLKRVDAFAGCFAVDNSTQRPPDQLSFTTLPTKQQASASLLTGAPFLLITRTESRDRYPAENQTRDGRALELAGLTCAQPCSAND